MIQMGMTASIFTIFSHHANTPKDLVLTLRNSLVNDGGFNNMSTAEKQVTDVVKVDIHLDYTPDGKRYIDRISEITQLEEGTPYPDYDPNDSENSINEITREYYQRSTDRVGFTTRTILKYNLDTHTYEVRDRFSEYLENRLRGNLNEELRVGFDEFMLREWGPRKEAGDISQAEVAEQLEQMQAQIEKINDKYKNLHESEGNNTVYTDAPDELTAKLGIGIEEQAAENNMWKAGYKPEDDSENYSLDSFFDMDDYES